MSLAEARKTLDAKPDIHFEAGESHANHIVYFDGNLGPAQDVARGWLRSKGNSIEGGTSEIMLDIVAKRLLELPAD